MPPNWNTEEKRKKILYKNSIKQTNNDVIYFIFCYNMKVEIQKVMHRHILRRENMEKKKNKSEITYHNKDVLSKIMAENFKEKSLKVYGIDVPKIKQILPTNLPAIQVNEMRIDNLFLLEDGSVAIIDYESSVKWENYLKYLNYVVRILERYGQEAKHIRMIVIYTADVKHAAGEFHVDCLTLRLEQAYLRKIDSKSVRDELEKKLEKGMPLSDDEMMQFIILPLTYKGKEAKKEAVKDAVDLAKKITDKEKQMFVLSGILVFADKIIDSSTAKYIKEVIRMTQVAQMLLEEGRVEGREEGRKEGREEGKTEGRKEERAEGIKVLIDSLRSFAIPEEQIIGKLVEKYQLTKDEANVFIKNL